MFGVSTTFIIILLMRYAFGSECPSPSSIDVMNEEGTNFICAVRYIGKGSTNAIEACNNCDGSYPVTMMKDSNCDNEDDGWCPTGSIIVKAGCTWYGWEDLHYTGYLREWHGPNVFPDGCAVTGDSSTCPAWCNGGTICGCYALGPRSAKCRCEQEPIICVPEDGYETVTVCDNTQGNSPLTCSYTKKIGTTYTTEAQNSMNIDVSIEYAMEAAFFKFFSESIGISGSTGYDWTHTSSETKSEEQSYTASTIVEPGTIWTLQGAIGRCGGNVAKTELFRALTSDSRGNIINEVYEKTFLNGTTTFLLI